jgi:thermitase
MSNHRLVAPALIAAFVLAGCGHPAISSGTIKAANSAAAKLARSRFPVADYDNGGTSRRQMVVKLAGRELPLALTRQTRGGPRVIQRIPQLGVVVVEVGPGLDVTNAMEDFKIDRAVRYVEPVNLVTLEKDVNDPRAGEQYAPQITHVREAWDVQMGTPNTVVCIIDSGVDMGHPDLKAKIVPESYNVLDHNNKPMDDHGHGTHCAGIAAALADNNEGGTGVAPGVGLMSVKVLDAAGRGNDATIAEGIVYAADHGAKVASMSLGLYKRSKVIEDALQYALDHDVVLVASAGNNNAENDPTTAPHLPSTYPGVIEVAATDAQDKKASFSNYGKTVSVAAPGVDILSTLPTYDVGRPLNYGKMSGTSMASPFVAGLAGLVRSQFPDLNREQVRARIEASADDLGAAGLDPFYGHGRVNGLKAVSP